MKFLHLKSVLSDISAATPVLFRLLFAWNIFFYSFTFNLFLSGPKWVYCRQHVVGSCISIYSDNLCLLFGEFNPFKVIPNKERLTFVILLFISYTPRAFVSLISCVLSPFVFSWFIFVMECLNSFYLCVYFIVIFFVFSMGPTFNILKF